MTELDWLVDVNKGIGIFITLLGALIVAPGGARRLWYRLVWRLYRGRIVQALVRIFSWLWVSTPPSRKAIHQVGGSVDLTFTASASVRVWPASAPVDVRIQALRDHIAEVEGQVRELDQKLREEKDARQQAIDGVDQRLTTEVAKVKQQLAAAEDEAEGADARGLPVVVAGVVLTGMPELIARLPLHLGWLVLAGGLAYTAVAVVGAIRAHRTPSPLPVPPALTAPPPVFELPARQGNQSH